MSLRLRFNLILAIACTGGLFVAQYFVDKMLMQQARAEVSNIAKASMTMALAVREYSSQQVRPLLIKSYSRDFVTVGVPAFAVKDTMRRFHARFPGHSYREVALNPTNPGNLAVGWEKTLVQKYRRGAIRGEFEILLGPAKAQHLNLARPLKITDPSCLACHGAAADAPPAMRAIYGDKNGFGWQMGEIVGAQIISIPASEPIANAQRIYRGFLAMLVGCFLLLFAALNWALYRLVIAPMDKANVQLDKIAAEDMLTGASTRRRFLELLQRALDRSKAEQSELAVVVFDVDRFKRINDYYGHAAGDVVLKTLSQFVMGTTKRRDHLGRLGGEEFALLLPATDLAGAMAVAKMLCDGFAQIPFDKLGSVTASFGVAIARRDDTVASLLHRADVGLYRAKHKGRNRVESNVEE